MKVFSRRTFRFGIAEHGSSKVWAEFMDCCRCHKPALNREGVDCISLIDMASRSQT